MITTRQLRNINSKRKNAITVVPVNTRDSLQAIPGLSPSDLSAFIGLGDFISTSESNLMQSFIDMAIDKLSKYSGYEPQTGRQYKFKYDNDGYGAHFFGFLWGSEWANMPRHPISTVDSVTVSGDSIAQADYDSDLDSNPPRVLINSLNASYDSTEFQFVEVDVTAGPASPEDVDQRFVLAVLALAGYMFTNRGCSPDSTTVLRKSGAKELVDQLRVRIGGI